MYKFNGKEKILQTIERLDKCLEENKVIIDACQGLTREDLDDEIFDKCLVLADNSVKLMIVRKRLVRYLQETYGITLM